ncbi:hypothetical protein JTB14_024612 [Gonioctena quinquepunctata]|nr:hypothetical protein JTB14_024612 [Gonioctena quinquepunctata]
MLAYHASQLCDLIPHQGHHMMPHYVLQLVLMGAAMMFAVLVIGFLVIVDRTRLTNIIRARSFREPTVEELFTRALSRYGKMNNT